MKNKQLEKEVKNIEAATVNDMLKRMERMKEAEKKPIQKAKMKSIQKGKKVVKQVVKPSMSFSPSHQISVSSPLDNQVVSGKRARKSIF